MSCYTLEVTMEDQGNSDENIVNAIDVLTNMFGNIVSNDVIVTIAESCCGNLDLSVDAIMSITSDSNSTKTKSAEMQEVDDYASLDIATSMNNEKPPELSVTINQRTSVDEVPMSYVSAAQTAQTQSKQMPKPDRQIMNQMNFWTDQIRQIIMHHNNGARIMVIMRGLPGSGKSYLARKIIEIIMGSDPNNFHNHIFSADDFFIVRGKYFFDKNKISAAHEWNSRRIYFALNKGLSPIIVDNTHTEMWEMNFPVYYGVQFGYIIEIVEPNTPWKWNTNLLFKKNTHHVPFTSIKKMLDRYERDVTTDMALKFSNASYPINLTPPVLRKIPPVLNETNFVTNAGENSSWTQANCDQQAHSNARENQNKHISNSGENCSHSSQPMKEISDDKMECTSYSSAKNDFANENNEQKSSSHNQMDELEKENTQTSEEKNSIILHDKAVNQNQLKEAEKCLKEIEEVEQEWENGEMWEDGTKKNNSNDNLPAVETAPKPPRNSVEAKSNKLMESVKKCEDWSRISMYMSPWHDETETIQNNDKPIPTEKKTSTTCVEIGDTDPCKNSYKIISAVARDINSSYTTTRKEKIPDQRMLDKSTMTNEQVMTDSFRCKNEEKHFVAFRKLFKNISRADLRDVFDKCCGDVNWAVDIVFDGMASKLYDESDAQDTSDAEEDIADECDCLAAYNIIPDRAQAIELNSTAPESNDETKETRPLQQKRPKQEVSLSETVLQLKKEIEKSVKISEEHYSPHFLRIRQLRRGEYSTNDDLLAVPSTSGLGNNYSNTAATPTELECKSNENEVSSISDDDTNSEAVSETYVTVDLSKGLIQILDELFDRKQMQYPENILPVASMPMSLMNEINALWVESLTYQLDQQSDQASLMLKQDAELARQLASKELEFIQEGREPVVPDFKEIMDMDLAVSLYQKDVAKWKKKEPQDLAAKMTREKLYNLFPEISQDVLGELLMAHENNFQTTVEVLLMSIGRTDILEAENGLNKFVMEKELQRQKTILEQERKALSEEEWPLLPKSEVVEMGTVQYYRDEAEMHLEQRNYNHNKAQHCIRLGMLQVADYYIDAANLHKQKYEIAKNLAVASLIQVHATRNPDSATIDLHYLRVLEAKESLDIFLDTHIRKLKESHARGGSRYNTLYFITGRGAHSNGRPKIKPAVKKRLLQRGLAYSERNPGMLTAKVCADDKLSYQLQSS